MPVSDQDVLDSDLSMFMVIQKDDVLDELVGEEFSEELGDA